MSPITTTAEPGWLAAMQGPCVGECPAALWCALNPQAPSTPGEAWLG